jgi:monofunctional biosynthetic peptidoglycan transglycosylase
MQADFRKIAYLFERTMLQEHFGVPASQLSRSQCALIAATLPNTRRFSSKSPSAYMLKRQKRILHEMRFVKPLPQQGEDSK